MIRFLIAAALLAASGAASAATLYLTEFTGAPPLSVYYQAARAPALTSQTVAIGAGSLQSAAFGTFTGLVRIHCDVICNITVGGTNPVATTSTLRLGAGQTEYFVVTPGDKVAVIAGT